MNNFPRILSLCIILCTGLVSPLCTAQDDTPAKIASSNESAAVTIPDTEPANDTAIAIEPQLSPEELDALLADYYTRAFAAFRNGEYPYAALMFEKYLALKPDSIKIYHYLSQIYIHLKQHAEAAVILKKVVELDPSNFANWYKLGTAYMGAGFTNEAIDSFEKALEIRTDIETLFQLGLCYERVNQLEKARELYEYIVAVKPNHADAHFSIGLLEFRTQNFSAALQRIDRALELKPDNSLYIEYREKVNAFLNPPFGDNDSPFPDNE